MSTEQQTEQNGKKRLRSAARSSLPLTSVIPDPDTFKQAGRLLKEAVKLKAVVSEAQERLDEISAELSTIAAVYELKGFRSGLVGYEYRGYTSRSALNKQKLVDVLSTHGLPAHLIDDCYEAGKEYLDARIVVFDME